MSGLKILYIAPLHMTGTLSLWKRAHARFGSYCRFITLFPSKSMYEEDILLNLPLISDSLFYKNIRGIFYRTHGSLGQYQVKSGYPPVWKPENIFEYAFFRGRDLLWTPFIEKAISDYHLDEFDVYHLEGGLGLFRSGKFIRYLKRKGKGIVCSYHGSDLRIRGVIGEIDSLSDVNLTCELDHLQMHPGVEYLFLPYDTHQFQAKEKVNRPVRICHATRNRYFKGSDEIIRVGRELEREENAEFVLIENRPHKEALEIKNRCDVYVDQIFNLGGWGYGMNSIEALSMGLVCCTNLVPEYERFIPDHPFVSISITDMKDKIRELIRNPELILEKGREGCKWVRKYHDIKQVVKKLYRIYLREGWIDKLPWDENGSTDAEI